MYMVMYMWWIDIFSYIYCSKIITAWACLGYISLGRCRAASHAQANEGHQLLCVGLEEIA